MSDGLNRPALGIKQAYERVKSMLNRMPPRRKLFWFTGDGVETDFILTEGYEPYQVFDAGSLQKEGSSDEYTVTGNYRIKTIVFAVAPAAGDICVDAEEIK